MKNHLNNKVKVDEVIFVSSILPPEHSGASKRIFEFYQFLKNEHSKVSIISHIRINNDPNIKYIKQIQNSYKLRKISYVITFFISSIKLLMDYSFSKQSKSCVVWLVSTTPLTFAASIIFSMLGTKIITQNTLIGSDDPSSRYPGDILSIKYALKRLQYKLSDVITTISPALYKISQNYHDHCVLIPNPVDIYKFQNNSNILERRLKKKVLIVGRLGFRKGTDIVLKTIIEIHKIKPDVEFYFIGPNENLSKLCSQIDIELSDLNNYNINLLGYLEEPSKYFKDSSLLFLPSRREGFGSVFIEALASGLPVVAKRIDGIAEFIFGKDYNYILDSEDHHLYARTILELLNNHSAYSGAIETGLKRVEKFRQEKIYLDYINIINKIYH